MKDLNFPQLKNSPEQFKMFFASSDIWGGIKQTVEFLYEAEKELLVNATDDLDKEGNRIYDEYKVIKGRCQLLGGIIATIENNATIPGENEDG